MNQEPKLIMPIDFKTIKTQEEFLFVFRGVCELAESAFSKLAPEALLLEKSHISQDGENTIGDDFFKDVSQAMSAVIIIRGMQGDYSRFHDPYIDGFFSVDVSGETYDQKYLYEMNDFFSSRLVELFKSIEFFGPKHIKAYRLIYRLS